ncbi:MAG: hypothetical protein ACRDRL_11445 [Sciscionella sp.]
MSNGGPSGNEGHGGDDGGDEHCGGDEGKGVLGRDGVTGAEDRRPELGPANVVAAVLGR